MTARVPDMPAPFTTINPRNIVKPNPRTVRASDFTWYNTSGINIIKTDYNTCSNEISQNMYPWGLTSEPHNKPFNLEPWGGQSQGNGQCNLFQRFDLYGLASKCSCELNRCGCSDPRKSRCALYGGNYVNPN